MKSNLKRTRDQMFEMRHCFELFGVGGTLFCINGDGWNIISDGREFLKLIYGRWECE